MAKLCYWVLIAIFAGSAVARDIMPGQYASISWEQLTVDQLADRVPEADQTFEAQVLPLRIFNVIPASIYFQLQQLWRNNGLGSNPQAIFISHGKVSLEKLFQKLSNPALIEQTGDRQYLVKRPIYIAHGAALLVREQSVQLSLKHGAFIIFHGDFFLQEGNLTTWDAALENYGPRQKLRKEDILLLGKQPLRPFLLGMAGSHTHLVGSNIRGLGYMSRPSTFGISISRTQTLMPKDRFTHRGTIAKLPNPTGTVIGNTIRDLMFGFFTNHANKIVLVGNLIYDSVIYNVDPHDYTNNALIARNVTARAKFKHGIIISREVDDAIIVENISINNGGAGIMIDRDSKRAKIVDNLMLDNDGEGISILESPDADIRNNYISRNLQNGVFIRNSKRTMVTGNRLINNGANGVELTIYDITSHKSRDIDRDPFQMAGSADLKDNHLDKNLRAAISSKGLSDLHLHNNLFGGSNGLLLGGDLANDAAEWLQKNTTGEAYP